MLKRNDVKQTKKQINQSSLLQKLSFNDFSVYEQTSLRNNVRYIKS